MRHPSPTTVIFLTGLMGVAVLTVRTGAAAIPAAPSTAPASTAPAAPANLLLNGGAEEGKLALPSIWREASVPSLGLRMWRDEGEAQSGRASLAIFNNFHYREPVSNNWAQTVADVPAGRTVVLRAAIKTTDADAANVCLQCWDRTGTIMLAYGTTPVFRGDTNWTASKSTPVLVPRETASLTVRAALTGRGSAWFDDLVLQVVDLNAAPAGPALTTAPALTTSPARDTGPGPAPIEPELAALAGGKVVAALPIVKDQMILQYMAEWNHGNLDNIAVANNGGGVRTLFAWPLVARANEAPGRRYVLAVYSRKTADSGPPGVVRAYRINGDWGEETSWLTQPATARTPAAEVKFEPGEGWKLFDVTSVVLADADPFAGVAAGVPAKGEVKRRETSCGVMLRFAEEDRIIEEGWSGYGFVSREGDGVWRLRRPVLLVVEGAADGPQAHKAAATGPSR